MTEDARDAEKKRRRAEALRANLKRRKAARGGRVAATEGEDTAGVDTREGATDFVADTRGT